MEAPLTSLAGGLDIALALVLPALAFRIVHTPDIRQAAALFLAFGLLMALTWARLEAPDIALVEAAVGTGLTGVLLMSALGWVETSTAQRRRRLGSLLLPAAAAAALAHAVLALGETRVSLTERVTDRLEQSGVSHAVTAVLLNFRAYDTLLEVLVLTAVAFAIRSLQPDAKIEGDDPQRAWPLLPTLVRILSPVFVLTAGYLVWRGSKAPGGAFQGGAVLAAGTVLLLLSRPRLEAARATRALQRGLILGPALFVGLAAALLVAGHRMLEYPEAAAKALIVALESMLVISIALALVMFFPSPLVSHADAPSQPEDAP